VYIGPLCYLCKLHKRYKFEGSYKTFFETKYKLQSFKKEVQGNPRPGMEKPTDNLIKFNRPPNYNIQD
jgi:hypothetical protein